MYRTEKKLRTLGIQTPKKFVRTNILKSDKSLESRKSSHQKPNVFQYIKTPKASESATKSNPSDFFKQLSCSITSFAPNANPGIRQQESGGRGRKLQNYVMRLETLTDELDLRNKEIDLLGTQIQHIKNSLNSQKQRRRKVEADKKELVKHNSQSKQEAEQQKLSIKKLVQERQSLRKQVQFLERINFDQKTRTLQSFREKSLQNQLERLRVEIKQSKTDLQAKLQLQIDTIQEEKYVLQSHFKSLKVANECLVKQLNQFQQQQRQFVINSEEYIRLRQKYRHCLDEYKQMRTEYWALKTQVNSDHMNSSSVLSITFSEVGQVE